ncbi:hypothetical protein SteCoe_26689 [Stentor coeruleus]|uniref:Calponin-homology (CH) domain-containing protein n=1 Tax=Stentor coeruleus TaxID=5963 RepID=A0A1R2BCA2_9CILI|nr:hypothetical protein SteCoe_26689 [Stentor coeruleus]
MELQSTIVEWINSCQLSRKCEKISELSDGLLLFEFMSRVNSEYFDIECLSPEPQNNWALRLANLKKLKKSLISYIDQELKIPYKRFDAVDLSGIARKEEPKDLLFLLELVVYAIVNSPYKEEFIKKIMDMDEECQTQFMFFIQKVLGEGDSPLMDPNIKVENREVLILRTEKQRMAVQIEELLDELKGLKATNQKITQERDEFQLINTDLRNEISKKSRMYLTEFSADSNELELALAEKENKVMQLTNSLNDVKASSEKEMSKLRDELDVATSKIYQLSQAEKTLQQYKKRIETLSDIKIKMQEVQKQNDELKEQLEMKDLELERINTFKREIKVLKNDLANERKNTENANYKVETFKKEMKKKESEIEQLREKIYMAESKIKDLEFEGRGQESPQNSEDSMVFSKLSELEDVCRTPLEVRRDNRRMTGNHDIEQARREKLVMQHKLLKAKAKSKAYKETSQMLNEELCQRKVETTIKLKQLESQLVALGSQFQVFSQNVSNAQNDKVKYEQCFYELEQLKNVKENLMGEVKKLYEEKDQTYQRLIECREQSMTLQNLINEKDLQLRQREITEKILNEKVQALTEKEKVSEEIIENLKQQKKEDSGDYMIRFVETEREVIALRSERSTLQLRLTEKEERLQEMFKDKVETIKKMEREHREFVERMKEENNRRMNQIINQCDEAITELQKERELVVAQLKIEKKNALQDWKKSTSLEWVQNNKEENNKLKEEIVKKEKEIIKLTKSNQEIKRCWKDATKLLKAVWKELGNETQKIQNATKRYN